MILVTGATGQLGTALVDVIPDARFLTQEEFDLTDLARIGEVMAAHEPDAIINCAAYTAVDQAEQDEEAAMLLNSVVVGELARYAAGAAIPFVTFSTDYVFDGKTTSPYVESAVPAPLSAYGRSKLAGERLAAEVYPDALIVRTSWLVSATHPNFVATILDRTRSETLNVVDDQQACPTIAADLAVAAVEALDRGATGVLHLTNQGPTTWFGLARRSVELAGLDPERVQPCTTAEHPRPATRPPYAVLGSERADALGIAPLPYWQDSLPAVVAAQVARLGIDADARSGGRRARRDAPR